MPEDLSPAGAYPGPPALRVRALAEAFSATDLIRLRIEGPGRDAVELRRSTRVPAASAGAAPVEPESGSPIQIAEVKADLVGILHLGRPAPAEGQEVDAGRELAYVEALGIRNPVRASGSGRIRTVACRDGQAVEYGQVLFEIDRS